MPKNEKRALLKTRQKITHRRQFRQQRRARRGGHRQRASLPVLIVEMLSHII
jgi:hypothetical protein